MATSFYFNKSNRFEQELLENLAIEMIKINGLDAYYLPRTFFNKDQILEEDVLSTFNRGYFIEMYLKNVNGFDGEKEMLTKFGIEIREQVTFVIARRRFEDEIGAYEDRPRPQEGDLIFFPINNGLFEIKFVDHDKPFYQISGRYVYELKCEKFEYSSERLNTGIEVIDNIEEKFSLENTGITTYLTTEFNNEIVTEANEIISLGLESVEEKDPGAQNEEFDLEAGGIIDFSEKNPFGDL